MRKLCFLFSAFLMNIMFFGNAYALSDTAQIRIHLQQLTQSISDRSSDQVKQLDKAADYIQTVFKRYADTVYTQSYPVDGKIYSNVICSFGPTDAKHIIIGAHYDVCGQQPGADDNGTGVTGLLELVRMLKGQKLHYRIDLVAYMITDTAFYRNANYHEKTDTMETLDLFRMSKVIDGVYKSVLAL